MQNKSDDETPGILGDIFDDDGYRTKMVNARNIIFVVGALQLIIGLVLLTGDLRK